MVKRLLVKKGGEFLPELTKEIPANGIITVGNDSSATVELNEDSIAPEQFVIVCEDASITLLCRVDGTEVNGTAFPQGALHNLQSGDVIAVGGYLIFAEGEEKDDVLTAAQTVKTANDLSRVQRQFYDSPEIAKSPTIPPEKLERSLTDVLEGLRSEEKFYFLIKDAENGNRRVYVETEEMWLGWGNSGNCVLTVETDEVEIPRAQIRKDWSGVVLYPLQTGNVWLNDETLTEPHRLKNDDKLFLLSKEGAKLSLDTVIKFHEPTALLILDSILPKALPPPINLDNEGKSVNGLNGNQQFINEAALLHTSRVPPFNEKARQKRLFFGHFTITEIIIMAIGTLITAAVIYLILELY